MVTAASSSKPNLFIVGAPKCGTTAWATYLATHPGIFFSEVKEPHFFATDFPPEGRIVDREEYLALFADRGDARVVGEASPTYLYSEVAAKEIRQFNPDAKIIILVRPQEDYLPSRHNQLLAMGLENLKDFRSAWEMSGCRDPTNMPGFCKLSRILDYSQAGSFAPQVMRYLAEFPPKQVRVFHFDDWIRNPRAAYLEIMRFLDLEDDGRSDFPAVNQAQHPRSRLIVSLIRNPPWLIRKAVGLIKRVTGRSRLGAANWLYRLNLAKGSATRTDDALRSELATFFRADNAAIEHLLWKPSDIG